MKKSILPGAVIVLILAAVFGIIRSGVLSPRPPKPDIVLIIVDALRADKLGCYGFPGGISPEIDALAADGVVFDNAYSLSCWTRPSMGSMFTGMLPRTLGIYKEDTDILADRFTTLAEALKARGYWTFGVTANPNINTVFNFQQGFDEYQDSRVVWRWMKARQGEQKQGRRFNLRQCRDIFEEILGRVASKKPEDGPVFVQAVIMEAHTPWIALPEYQSAYADYPVVPNIFHKRHGEQERFVRATLGAVRQVSHDIGEFVRKFRAIPGRENTLFVITSDHGQGLDDHPDVFNSWTHGNLLYRSHLKVPLIFFQTPGAGRTARRYSPHRVGETVTLLGFMPTILDYAGVPLPRRSRGTPAVQGGSLFPFIEGTKGGAETPDFFVAETHWRNLDKIAVYKDEWVYIRNRDGWQGVNPLELQLREGPQNGIKTDRIQENGATADEMKKLLDRWLGSHEAAKPEFRREGQTPEEIEQLKSLGYLK